MDFICYAPSSCGGPYGTQTLRPSKDYRGQSSLELVNIANEPDKRFSPKGSQTWPNPMVPFQDGAITKKLSQSLDLIKVAFMGRCGFWSWR